MHKNLLCFLFLLFGFGACSPVFSQHAEYPAIHSLKSARKEGPDQKGYTPVPNIQTPKVNGTTERSASTAGSDSLPKENMVYEYSRENKSLKDRSADQLDNTTPTEILPTVLSDELIYPDLQVTAIQESPQTQVFQGSERLPKIVAEKKVAPVPAENISAPNTNQTSTIGKVSFLKQYAAELKVQIEKNKDNANYPMAEKQKELLELEDLLKGE